MRAVYKNLIVLALSLLSTGVAQASVVSEFIQDLQDLKWEDGRVRLEGQGWIGTRSGRRSRTDDRSIVGTIEKEFVLNQQLTVGLRAIPLFYYDQNDKEIWAAGGGVALRHYSQKAQDGYFFEFTESFLGQSDTYWGNSGSFNFMTELGVGYEFDNDWHVAAKWRHLSNAGIAHRNSGINAIGISVGFSF